MYQILVIGLGLLFVIGGGYYISRTDSNGVIQNSLSHDVKVFNSTTTDESSVDNNTDVYSQ